MTKLEIPDLLRRASNVPKGGAVIYRHFGAEGHSEMAQNLRAITKKNGVQYLIGKDDALAVQVGADGVHLPECDLGRAEVLRDAHPEWIITGAVHDFDLIDKYPALDAVIYAKVSVCGRRAFTAAIRDKVMPVIALGGISAHNANDFIFSGAAGLAGSSGFALAQKTGFQPYVKPARADMAGGLAKLHALCFDKSWPEKDFAGHIDNDMDTVLAIENKPRREGYGAVLGFIIMRTSDTQAEILTIAVHPKLQGSGMGAALLEIGIGSIPDAEILFLEVAKDNVGALALYKSFGFVGCGTRPGYYKRKKGRVDALLFQKHLP